MIFKLFHEKGRLKSYLMEENPDLGLLSLEYENLKMEEVEEEAQAFTLNIPFLGSQIIPQKTWLLSIPVRGNWRLLFYEPEKRSLFPIIDGILEEQVLYIKTSTVEFKPLIFAIKEAEKTLNEELSSFKEHKHD